MHRGRHRTQHRPVAPGDDPARGLSPLPSVRLGDVSIAYEVTGDGEPVVLVAGCGTPATSWQLGLGPRLVRAGYQVVTFDNRGVAPSSSPPGPYRVDQMATDALGLLDHLGLVEPLRMAGHSMGGWIIETLMTEHPERVRAGALIGSANRPTAWEKAITTTERDLSRDYPDLPALFYATETLRYLPNRELQDDQVVEGWLALIGDMEPWPNPGRLGQYEACLAWSTDPVRTTRWADIEVPCLVVAFEHDIDSPPARAREAAEVIPGAAFVEVAGASHLGVITHVGAVGEALVAFFDSV